MLDMTGGCETCLTRRDFLGRVALVAAAVIAAGCGGAEDFTGVGSGSIPGGPLTIKVSDYAGLATVGQPVELRNATGANSGVAAVRTGTSSFIAVGMACTHQGVKVNISGSSFDCPAHGSRFTSTGAVTNGPANSPLFSRTVVFDPTAQTLVVS